MHYLYIFLLFFTLNSHASELDDFIVDVKNQALKSGISQKTIDKVFMGITLNNRILELDNSQAEFNLNFWQYIKSHVSQSRISIGKHQIQKNTKLLQNVYHKYGVPRHILIAFWGLESNYGKNTGKFGLVRSLLTLSFDKRRRKFFTQQLLISLKLIDDNKIAFDTKSSWAGAMGGVQFMPSNVKSYGVDKNADGKIDLWNTNSDIFSSAANFLQNIGWNTGEKWGREVSLSDNFNFDDNGLNVKKSLQEWSDLGVKTIFGGKLPKSILQASLIFPMGYKGPAFLVYRNFRAILGWNRSILYALSVGILADELNGKKLKSKFIDEPKISKNDIQFIQQNLTDLFLYDDKIDGISGLKTRNAVRDYQTINDLPADGYVGYELLQKLKNK